MRRLLAITITYATAAALAAVAATTMASAAAPEFSKTKVKFTSFGGPGTLAVVGGSKIECKKDKDTGEITSKTTITDTIDIEECKAEGIVGSHSLGDPEGTILTTVTGTLCLIAAKDVGILLVPTAEVHVEIPTVATLMLIKGSITGLITPINIPVLRSELHLTVKEEKQVPEECEGKKDELLFSLNGGAFKKSTFANTKVLGYLVSEVEIIE